MLFPLIAAVGGGLGGAVLGVGLAASSLGWHTLPAPIHGAAGTVLIVISIGAALVAWRGQARSIFRRQVSLETAFRRQPAFTVFAWSFELGVGLTTYVVAVWFWAFLVLAPVFLSAGEALIAGAWYGVVRGVAVTMPPILSSDRRRAELPSSMIEMRRAATAGGVAVLVGLLLVQW